MASSNMPGRSRCWSGMAGRAPHCFRMAATRCRWRSRAASGLAVRSPIRVCSGILAALPTTPELMTAICGCRSGPASASRGRPGSIASCGSLPGEGDGALELRPQEGASNPGNSSLDVLGKQLPRLGSVLGVSEEPNKHVMGQRDALASIVLVDCEIAHRRIDHLKQNVLGG